MASIDKIKIGNSTYDITTSWSSITDKPSSFTPANHSHTKSEVGLGNVDNTADANKNVNHANSAGSANYFKYGRGATLANSSSFTNNFCKDIFGEENNNNYHLVELRTNNQAPSCLLGDYSSGIAWKGADTYGSLMVKYKTSEIRVSGGNGANTNPNWTVDLVHSGNIGSQNVNYANSAGSVAWGNVTDKPSTFTPAPHYHDDRYYTEWEINDKLKKYLPLDGSSAMTGALDLTNSSDGIKICKTTNGTPYYVTNIQVGSVQMSLNSSSGSTNSNTVNFYNYSKGQGSWYIVTTVSSSTTYPETVISCVSSISSKSFTVKIKRIASVSGGNPSCSIDYIAIKYY